MDDLIQVLFFILIVIFGLLGGSKKKKKTEAPGSRPRPRTPEPTASAKWERETPVPRSRPVEARRPPTRDELEASLYDLLRGARPEPTRPAPEPEAFAEEAQSVETLTPAGGESHRRFHERYVDLPPATVPRPLPRFPTRVDTRTLREAVVWREILGQPKGLD